MQLNDHKSKRKKKLNSFVLNAQIMCVLILLVLGSIALVCASIFYFPESEEKQMAEDKATEKILQELNERGCVYYTEGRYGTGLEFVCPAANDSLEIIDFGSNLKPNNSIHDRKEQAHKHGYSYKEWNGSELLPKE